MLANRVSILQAHWGGLSAVADGCAHKTLFNVNAYFLWSAFLFSIKEQGVDFINGKPVYCVRPLRPSDAGWKDLSH